MARFCTDDQHISQDTFANIPAVYEGETTFIQAPRSTGGGSVRSISEASSQCGRSLREGDLITGIIDVTNERAHMIPANRAEEREELVCASVHSANHLT
jgi:hypothetical protein